MRKKWRDNKVLCQKNYLVIKDYYKKIGNIIKENKLRVDLHPSAYTVLNSINDTVVSSTINILEFYQKMYESMEIYSKIVLHVGSKVGGKKAGIGIGGIVIAALITWLMGGNPLSVLESTDMSSILTEQSQGAAHEPTAEEEELAKFNADSSQHAADTADQITGLLFRTVGRILVLKIEGQTLA